MKQNHRDLQNLPNTLMPFIWRYLKNKKLYLSVFLLVALIWATELSLSPYLFKVIIDAVVKYSQNQAQMLNAVLIPFVLYASISMIMNFTFRLYNYISLRLYPELKAAVSKDVFTYLIHHSQTFFQNSFSGSLSKKINDLTEIEQILIVVNETFLPQTLNILISSATLFLVVKPIFGSILFVWALLFICFSYIAAKKSEKLARHYSEAFTKLGGTMNDSISNVISTKLFANFSSERAYLDKDIDNLVASDCKLQWRNLKINFVQNLSASILIISMLTTLIYGRIHGWVTAGDFALVLMLSISFLRSIWSLGQEMLKFSKTIGSCNQALSFIREPHEIVDSPNAKPIKITKGEIKLQNISFSYENSNPLFENLNITINPGEKVGLVGYSGGGKSTFIKLILRLLDVQSGAILIDNQDVTLVTEESLRKQIGTIPQETNLFHRTIMENIRFAKIGASDEEVVDAAKKAGCHEFISELPEQYQSLVGERGIKLSGGQKQRIAIARAFLKGAPILLLDEATSSLDSVTERYIQQGLREVMAGKTTVVIAHRLSTLQNMDRILVFVSGKVVEDGSLKELLENKDGHFYKLWQMQSEGFIQLG